MSAPLVSLAGPPASGKTTVARWLAESLGGSLLLEDYAGNPFLARSYAGRTDLRLAGQTWFLLSRVNQLESGRWPAGGCVVSDYAFLQDPVYAHVWLAGQELAIYEQLFARMVQRIHPPQVLVHLDGPVELLLQRVAGRGRDFEKYFTADFLARLRADYNTALASAQCPVLTVDIAEHDLRDPARQQWLLEQVRRVLEGSHGTLPYDQ